MDQALHKYDMFFFYSSKPSKLCYGVFILIINANFWWLHKSVLFINSLLDDLLIVILHFAEEDNERTIDFRLMLCSRENKKFHIKTFFNPLQEQTVRNGVMTVTSDCGREI